MSNQTLNQNQRGDIGTIAAFFALGFVVTLILAIPIITVMKQSTHRTETVEVERTERISEGKTSRYLIWTNQGVFENTDSLLNGKFDSSDLYGQLKIGKTYTCDTIGWRVPLLSWYPNLITCEEQKP